MLELILRAQLEHCSAYSAMFTLRARTYSLQRTHDAPAQDETLQADGSYVTDSTHSSEHLLVSYCSDVATPALCEAAAVVNSPLTACLTLLDCVSRHHELNESHASVSNLSVEIGLSTGLFLGLFLNSSYVYLLLLNALSPATISSRFSLVLFIY
jgi:hypothetical protein